MEQIALIMNNMLPRSAAYTPLCCNGNWQFQKPLVCDNKKILLFKWIFTRQLTVYGASKCESHGYF